MFLGWFDPDKKRPARDKLADAIERHLEKFGEAPVLCLTHAVEAAELAADPKAPTLPIRAVGHLPRWTFYVGFEDEAPVDVSTAA